MWSRIANEFLFWFHLTVIIAGMALSFIISPFLVLAVTALHQVHLRVFNGCSITLLQQRLGGLRTEQRFCDSAWERFMGRYPTVVERRVFHHAQWVVPVFGATLRFILRA